MDKKVIEEKLATLKKQKEEIISTANAISGAIQFAENLLLEFDNPVQKQ